MKKAARPRRGPGCHATAALAPWMQKERLPSPWDNRPTTLARPAALEKFEKRSSSGSRYGPHWPGRPAMSKPLRPRAATKPRGAALGWNTTERAWTAERPSGFKAVKTKRTPRQLGVHRSLTRPARRGAKNQRKKSKFSTIFENFKKLMGNSRLSGRGEQGGRLKLQRPLFGFHKTQCTLF